ncbi:DeoR family transcriptional regulator, partial [Aestuariivirga sp.]|uniref:DeoR family transcriptional regulator n=1 Tax=Aestuariivirga sp. TaxID=2650926 RepID=UPI0030182911
MTEAERHKLMLDLLRDRPFASVRDLQAVVDASPATIRRDIAKLHVTGAVRKVFGGIAAA